MKEGANGEKGKKPEVVDEVTVDKRIVEILEKILESQDKKRTKSAEKERT